MICGARLFVVGNQFRSVERAKRLWRPIVTQHSIRRAWAARLLIQPKLDELIRAVKEAGTGMGRLAELSDEELRALTGDFEQLRRACCRR